MAEGAVFHQIRLGNLNLKQPRDHTEIRPFIRPPIAGASMAMAVEYVDQGTNAMYCLEQLLIGPSELDRIIGALAETD